MKKQRVGVTMSDTLRRSEQRFDAIWDAAADAMAVSDAQGIALGANAAYYDLYGYSAEQVLGHSFAIIFPPEHCASAVEQYTALFQSHIDIPMYESTIQTADGSQRIVEARATFVPIEDGKTALLSIIGDITARKRLEQERDHLLAREQTARIEAEVALRVRDQFLAVAAHELKTPLTALRGTADVMLRRAARDDTLSEGDQRTLRVIATQAKRLHGLIDSLLDIGRIQAGGFTIERRALNLFDLVHRLVEETQPTLEHHTLHLEHSTDTLMVVGDAGRLEQVVQNLLQNAVKYSPTGGVITVRSYAQGERVYLAVRDEGIGIPEAAQGNLFQQFYRGVNAEEQQISGMGIGLYVVKEIVALHRGDVTVESREGQGSTFTISLPRS